MKRNNIFKAGSLTWMVLFSIILAACAPNANEIPVSGKDAAAVDESAMVASSASSDTMDSTENVAMAEDVVQPAEPGEAEQILEDADASLKASEKRAVTGENYTKNLFERPFTNGDMNYLADLNILTASIASDDSFIYFTIQLDGFNASNQLGGTYAIEFDRDKDGRGDLLVSASMPASEWSMQDVNILKDMNIDVGGEKPMLSEVFESGNGYEEVIENNGLGWARLTPQEDASIQIAINRSLVEFDEFLWGAWADAGLRKPGLFDYHDAFTQLEAGMAIRGDDYPLKAVAELDNTCRKAYNFTSSSGIPGLCISIPKTEPKEPEKAPPLRQPPGTAPD